MYGIALCCMGFHSPIQHTAAVAAATAAFFVCDGVVVVAHTVFPFITIKPLSTNVRRIDPAPT